MTLLHELVKLQETAAAGSTSAAGVAGFRGMLFGTPDKLQRRPEVGNVQVVKFNNDLPTYDDINNGHKEHKNKNKNKKKKTQQIKESNKAFNKQLVDGVLSRLRSNLKQTSSKFGTDTVVYGLEDDNGHTVKVTIAADQQREFESKLKSLLRTEKKLGVKDITTKELGEILFDIRKEFDILDVVWPKIKGDSEEEEITDSSNQNTDNEDLQLDTTNDSNKIDNKSAKDQITDNTLSDDNSSDNTLDNTSGDTSEVKTLLQQIIKMMQTDAEAKMMQAKAQEAKYANDIAQTKMQQQQSVLDMEAYYKQQKKQDTESKQLQQLAKWKHELAQQQGSDLTSNDIDSGDVNLDINLNSTPDNPERDNKESDLSDLGDSSKLTNQSLDSTNDEENEEVTSTTGQLTNQQHPTQLLKYLLKMQKAQR